MNRYDEPGKGRKLCKGCEKYVPVAVKTCVCGNSFEYGRVIIEKQKQEELENKSKESKEKETEIEQIPTENEQIVTEIITELLSYPNKLNIEIELNSKINSFQIALLKKQNKIKWSDKIEEELKHSTRPFVILINDKITEEDIKNWFFEKKINAKIENNFEILGQSVDDPDLLVISFLKDFPKIKNISWKWKNNDETFLINLKKFHDYKISLLKKKIQKSTS
jgi:hypothetical protein